MTLIPDSWRLPLPGIAKTALGTLSRTAATTHGEVELISDVGHLSISVYPRKTYSPGDT